MTLFLPPSVAEAIIDHAVECLPNESCGLLAGHQPGGEAAADAFHVVETEHATPFAFRMSVTAALVVVERIEAAGQIVLGVVHSHPQGSADLSRTDVSAAWPGLLQVVCSLRDETPVIRAWSVHDAVVVEVPTVLAVRIVSTVPTGG